MTDLAAFPVPPFLSDQAKAALSAPPGATSYPAPGDTDAWLRLIEQSNADLARRLEGRQPLVVSEEREIAGVHTYVLRAEDVPDEGGTPVYLDIHGGALISGGGVVTRLMSAPTAYATGMVHWAVDYRMPPLHPYPAALDDLVAVYRALLDVRDPADVVVGGGSAGGNLAAALLLRARDEGLPLPGTLVLLTPEADLTESGDTFTTLARADNTLGRLREVNLLYAAGHDLTEPYLSPLFGDLRGFPPTFLQAGTRDLFLSNTVRMHRKLRAAGVDAELHVFEAMPHGGFGGAPEDAELLTELRAFLDKHRRR